MHRKLISAAVLTLIGLAGAPAVLAAPVTAASSGTTTQLPRGVIPSHYALSLTPDAQAATFKAKVAITLAVSEPTSSITLNAVDLVFAGASISGTGKPGLAAQAADKIVSDAERQTATFHFAKPLAKGNYQLSLDYSGKIRSQATGLFFLDYDTPQGRKRALYTQFENSDARGLIPSWDEPNYKATFSLETTVPSDEMALSNMPVASSADLGDGRKLVKFGITPKMSTYLLFFGVGDFERAAKQVDGTEIGVVTRRGALEQGKFALDESAAVLREYNDYFGVRYPLPKLDNIAAPGRSQFFGAMENWGAVFTFEQALLLDPAFSTVADKQNIFTTMAHETAHQWFGDLVTMRWWDDLWLNEGFASWMEGRTTELLHPEWNTKLEAVAGREGAMAKDALSTTHPVVQRIATVEQASQAFDTITYDKGQAVIRMLEAYVGSDGWRDGVRGYMKAHAYGNTVSDDLWRAVEKAAHKPITAIAHDFTLQPGIPMISVGDAVCRNGRTRVTLTQTEFSKDQPNKKALSWRVPVIAQTIGNTGVARVLVTNGKASLDVPGCGAVLVNAGQSGYFRTLYQPAGFARLAAGFAGLAPIDQLGLLADTQALGQAGLQPASDVLDLVNATPLDADSQVWGRIASTLNDIHHLYAADPARQKAFGDYAIARLAPVLARTGWTIRPDESSTVANLRSTLILTLSDLGDPAVIAEARRRYAAQHSDATALPPALRKVILSVVAQNADAAAWDALRASAQQEKSQVIKSRLYELLGASKDVALAQRALELALTDEPGLTNSAAMISRVSYLHPDLAFDFALAHQKQVEERVDYSSLSRYLSRLAATSADPAMVGKLQAYAQAKLAAEARGEAQAAVAGIQYRIKVRKERLPAIDAWLAKLPK
ncbi:M1 family metallopeptidase [Janthinobacterium agaricidamnosum]|uniref:Aminopeptidase n=1 Tax=Janthinobacterium agaricidamnosum NBRC 102515 = DSM 9628 TaxID=1349767 RepID=W0V3R4_9BURK|nr:M1 family metallopeptidase [Janthinobacterium agaricidamnosum]CDG82511.1 peptidase M1 family protein [Janthinobacterium agaricidamnosum NBRC 102515 = DSM 9628]